MFLKTRTTKLISNKEESQKQQRIFVAIRKNSPLFKITFLEDCYKDTINTTSFVGIQLRYDSRNNEWSYIHIKQF